MIKDFKIFEIFRTSTVSGDNSAAATETSGATFKISSSKLYVSLVTLFINDNINALNFVSVVTLSVNDTIIFLKNLKQGFKRTIS